MSAAQHHHWYKALIKLLMQDRKHSSFQVSSQVFQSCLQKLGMSFGHPVVDDIMLKCVIQTNGDVNFHGLINALESGTPEKTSLLHKRIDEEISTTQNNGSRGRLRNQQSSIQQLLDHSSHDTKSTQNPRKEVFDTIRRLIRELDVGILSSDDFRVSSAQKEIYRRTLLLWCTCVREHVCVMKHDTNHKHNNHNCTVPIVHCWD